MIITNGASILNLGPGLRRDVWIFAAISIVTVILRIVSKARMGKFAQDDVLVIFALISNTNQYNNVKSSERYTVVNYSLILVHFFDRVDNTHDWHRKWIWSASMEYKY